MKIDDGKGTGKQAEVDSYFRLKTQSVVLPEDKQQNINGAVWSVKQSTTPVGANDYLFYFKNTGTETYAITDIRAWVAGASKLYIQAVTGVATHAAGVDLTPVTRNLGSSKTITGTLKEDTNTTGLTGSDLFVIPCPVADTLYHLSTSSNIIIPPGQAIAMYTTGTTAVETIWSFVLVE